MQCRQGGPGDERYSLDMFDQVTTATTVQDVTGPQCKYVSISQCQAVGQQTCWQGTLTKPN